MAAEDWVEIMAGARRVAPEVPASLWYEVELAMRGWSVAQEAAGYCANVERVVAYARALVELAKPPAVANEGVAANHVESA